jgi:protein translocase SecG subunit
MKQILTALQITVSLILIGLILVQARGTGFGRSGGFGGGNASFSRRGLEKLVFRLTFVVAFLFIAISILQLLV